MGVSVCGAGDVDDNCRENIFHGEVDFPVAIYKDNLETEEVPWHWHVEIELIYVLEGEGIFSCNDKKYILSAGQGIFINGGNLHGCWVTEKGHCDLCSIVFHPKFAAGGADSVLWRKYISNVTENRDFDCLVLEQDRSWKENILEDILEGWQAIDRGEDGFEFTAREKLSEILFLLYKNMDCSKAVGTNKRIRNSSRMKLMMDFIMKNFAEDIKVKDVAASAMVSESECLRCFKDFLGQSTGQYIKSVRLQKALEYLSGTDLAVCKVAELCGFSDESYFGKQFKKEKGMTPLEYRKAERGRL